MPVEEHTPGESAPATGTYELLNPMGTPAGTRVEAQAGEALPPAPFRWTWRLVTADGEPYPVLFP